MERIEQEQLKEEEREEDREEDKVEPQVKKCRSRWISQERLKQVQETMMRLTISIPFGIINLPVKSSTVSVTNLTQ